MRVRRGVAGSLLALALAALLALIAIWSRDLLSSSATPVFIIGLAACVAVGSLLVPLPSAALRKAPAAGSESEPSVDDLVGMLGDTLRLAQDTRSEQQPEAVDIPSLVGETARRHPDLKLKFAGEPRPMLALASRGAIGRAFEILIENAGAHGQRIAVECDCGTSSLVVHVDDDGPGIARQARERIFELSYYMSTPPSQRSGCCAELVIARQIARAAGGDIVASASPLGGARLTLRLPLLARPDEATFTPEIAQAS